MPNLVNVTHAPPGSRALLSTPSPFPHDSAVTFDPVTGEEIEIVVVKVDAELRAGVVREEQRLAPLRNDEHDAAGVVVRPADLVVARTGTSVVILGRIYPGPQQRLRKTSARVRVGPIDCTATVFGKRRWIRGTGGTWTASAPDPVDAVDAGFSSAFGGQGDLRNPVGTGVFESELGPEGVALPQLEDPTMLVRAPTDRPSPRAFGPRSPRWEPRRTWNGTLDDRWKRTRWPLWPGDFDPRAGDCAPDGLLATPWLRGGERLVLEGFDSTGVIATTLPRREIRLEVRDPPWLEVVPLRLELVVIEPDADRLTLTYAARVPRVLGRRPPRLRLFEKPVTPLGQRRERAP